MISTTNSWVTREFQSADLGDHRLTNRLVTIIKRLASKFGSNISSSFTQWKDIKAVYRFLSNEKVKIEAMLAPHKQETIKRIRSTKRVLLIQDTTYFNFGDRQKTQGLDITQRSKLSKESEGLMLHNTLTISENGVPLGLIDQHYIDRKTIQGDNFKEKRTIRHWNNCIEEKESVRWISTIKKANKIDFGKAEIIHIADRESDIYEFYRDALELGEHFVIRAARNRSINKKNRREAPSTYLFDYLEAERVKGKINVEIQVNGEAKFRNVHLSVIYKTIFIPPPPNKTKKKDGHLPIVKLSAVMAIERTPPKGYEALCWVLLTDLPIHTLEDAIEKINWYTLRWNIELFHKVLKSGCSVEKAQLRHADRLKKYITLKSVIAWRLFWLSRSYKINQNSSCTGILTEKEWTILYRKIKKAKPPRSAPTVGEVFYWIAKLGGYIGRRSDPPPGMISIWRGWQRLMDMIEDYTDICG